MQNINQTQEFLYFCLIGVVITFIFDIFRSIRKNFKTSDKLTCVEDIIFLIISTLLIMTGIVKFSNGIIRFYIFLGIFIGITIYSLTISKFCIIILSSIVAFCKKIFILIIKFFEKIFNFIKKLGKKLQL